MKHFAGSVIAALLFASAMGAQPALAQDIESIRKEFNEKTGAALASIKDLAAVEEVSSRLPGGVTLRQTIKIFVKNGNIRQEVEATTKGGARLKFLTIMANDEIWTITPNGKMVRLDASAHGGIRPDPLIKYLALSIKPGAKLAGKELWEGTEAFVVDNGGGEIIWLDPKSMTPFKIETFLPGEGGAQWVFWDFKPAGGAGPLPHEIKYSSDSAVFFHHVALLAVNAGLDDDLFDPQTAMGKPGK